MKFLDLASLSRYYFCISTQSCIWACTQSSAHLLIDQAWMLVRPRIPVRLADCLSTTGLIPSWTTLTLANTMCMGTWKHILVRQRSLPCKAGMPVVTYCLQPPSEVQDTWFVSERGTRTAGKLAGLDRKLCKNLEEDVEADCSPLQLSKSPVGPLAESSRCQECNRQSSLHPVALYLCITTDSLTVARAVGRLWYIWSSHWIIFTQTMISACCALTISRRRAELKL